MSDAQREAELSVRLNRAVQACKSEDRGIEHVQAEIALEMLTEARLFREVYQELHREELARRRGGTYGI